MNTKSETKFYEELEKERKSGVRIVGFGIVAVAIVAAAVVLLLLASDDDEEKQEAKYVEQVIIA